jgi:hypothetical protein
MGFAAEACVEVSMPKVRYCMLLLVHVGHVLTRPLCQVESGNTSSCSVISSTLY